MAESQYTPPPPTTLKEALKLIQVSQSQLDQEIHALEFSNIARHIGNPKLFETAFKLDESEKRDVHCTEQTDSCREASIKMFEFWKKKVGNNAANYQTLLQIVYGYVKDADLGEKILKICQEYQPIKSRTSEPGFQDTVALDSREQVNKICRVLNISDSRAIEKKFSKMLFFLIESFKTREIQVSQIKSCLISLKSITPIHVTSSVKEEDSLFEIDLRRIKEASDVISVFEAIANYMSFYEFHIIEVLVEILGSTADQENLEEYKKEFEKYARNDIPFGSEMKACPSLNQYSCLVIKLDESYERITYLQLRILKSNFAEILGINVDALILERVESGSVLLVFCVTLAIKKKVSPIRKELLALLRKFGIVDISSNNFTIGYSHSIGFPSTGGRFGQRKPPLSVTIKAILERYPDGQIFKETIQNADDAGANRVWFYIDERHHSTTSLPHSGLAQFQGPALVAANDAIFTEQDWEGIQSLQQSVKAEDPFKVGRFGIGFNSVYHLTDLPIIVSGNRYACFEPQETLWPGESGKEFSLSSLSPDLIAPLEGLGEFHSGSVRANGYPKTMFRLPLRTASSGMSDNVYSVPKLTELLDALREEAKYLLLFLKSVYKIEVIHISPQNQKSLSFCVEVADSDRDRLIRNRRCFIQKLKDAHTQVPYQISDVISFTDRFSVSITDRNPRSNQTGRSNWCIANSVGSGDPAVLQAAAKQKVFPWVGAAAELGDNPARGRLFCFLPMPVEATSGLPVHVNGTFGLNDERRTLKWPGPERRNDPTANWNKMLVSLLIPPCYILLLNELKKFVSAERFYLTLPDAHLVSQSQFSEIPLFTLLFREATFWTKKIEALQEIGKWITLHQATFISEGAPLPSVMERVLSQCGVQLVTLPPVVWRALRLTKTSVREVNPRLARSQMRLVPSSYSSLDPFGKREVLRYSLSDNAFDDLQRLEILPLVNGNFTYFDGMSKVYLCTSDCPCHLLPNMEHVLVDLSGDDHLQQSLYQVASSQKTKLCILGQHEVATLLQQALHSQWSNSSLVAMPHYQYDYAWLSKFWMWLKTKQLKLFQSQLIVPCYSSTSDSTSNYCLTQLSTSQPVVFIGKHDHVSPHLRSALYKLNVRICLQQDFSFIQHSRISNQVKQFNTNDVFDAIYCQSVYNGMTFTLEEAESIRSFLNSSRSYTPNRARKDVLQKLSIFVSTSPERLFSMETAASQSIAKVALGEPSNCVISLSNLPSNLVLLSSGNHTQHSLLQRLNFKFPQTFELLVNHVLPLVRGNTFPDQLIDDLMCDVLDKSSLLTGNYQSITVHLTDLSFVKTKSGRRSPKDLFDPYLAPIQELYRGEDVFPVAPFNTSTRLAALRSCGLQTTVTPQQVLDIIHSISGPSNSRPQQTSEIKISRAKAVIKYLTSSFLIQASKFSYLVPNCFYKLSIRDALKHLATKRSWLPLDSEKPVHYPDELPWKGQGYDGCMVSLTDDVLIKTPQTDPCLVGSQMYIISTPGSQVIEQVLNTSTPQRVAPKAVAHFKLILNYQDELSANVMESLVNVFYCYMNNDSAGWLRQLYSLKKWIFIRKENKFISPEVVGLKQCPSFRTILEPYLYILPDTLSRYTTVFGVSSGVKSTISQDQVLSILTMIRDRTHQDSATAHDAWSMVMAILNWLTDQGTKDVSSDVNQECILVPIEDESSEWPQLVQATETVYTDNEFLKEYTQNSGEDNFTFVNSRVNNTLALKLGVVPLSQFLDISEDTFEDAGQYEPLTTRLNRILKEYKDGLTIIQELIQNADDAEATEVNILYDTRQHETNPKKLFFSGMSGAHGPALIVHNNKTFTDEDFKNITKLAGATKQNKVLKIGKFGIGFCSVYHVTDVPSFISRDYFYIFDPTLTFLKKEVKNPNQPGKKIKFTHRFVSSSKQLAPYEGLFGFSGRESYNGTIFRLPFRTSPSELSGTFYNEPTIDLLKSDIQEAGSNLLLFLQHVKTITFQRIDPGQSEPVTLLKLSREDIKLLTPSLPQGVHVRRISTKCFNNPDSNSHWLVSKTSEDRPKYRTASLACSLRTSDFKINTKLKGKLFCFLPLAKNTGLPVHVSSNFAVANNRRGIWTSDEASTQEQEVQWNVSLMTGVIPQAYLNLLIALREMDQYSSVSNYSFHSIWPRKDQLQQQNPWGLMVDALYEMITSETLFYSDQGEQWLSLADSKFLKADIMSLSAPGSSSSSCVLAILKHLGVPIVNLPVAFHKYLNLTSQIIDEEKFFEMFFNSIDKMEEICDERNDAIRYMLELFHHCTSYQNSLSIEHYLKYYFTSIASIPCCPNGERLRLCTEVVSPNSPHAELFDDQDERFPIEALVNRQPSMAALESLGMLNKQLPWEMLIERAETIATLYKQDSKKAMRRAQIILLAASNPTGSTDNRLAKVEFLPVISKPTNYPTSWSGDGHSLLSVEEVMLPKDNNIEVTGSQKVMVNTENVDSGGCGPISVKTAELLGITLYPTFEDIVAHFSVLIRDYSSQGSSVERIERMCLEVYRSLNNYIMISTESQQGVPTLSFGASVQKQTSEPCYQEEIDKLLSLRCVWTGAQFVKVDSIAKQWSLNGPYVYPVPSILSIHKLLCKALNVKEKFTLADIAGVLSRMKDDFGDSPINENCQSIFKQFLPILTENDGSVKTLMLPDEDYVLHPSTELAFNDAPWAPKDPEHKFTHELLTRKVVLRFGVEPVRSKFLEKFISPNDTFFQGEEFGQHEELTQRIQNILERYPLDETLFKELIQNADDAKASKLFFILDKRTHGDKSILSEEWASLQGPALLVWNDSIFSEDDLKGIQKLGLGSKRYDDETIGQYGIGFNVVYHLTDCPSFITGGNTMCVFDPHCRFVPGADRMKPGRRINVDKDFWTTFKDMKSPYLQDMVKKSEIQRSGSLFRFPLRHTQEMVGSSKILNKASMPKPITANIMEQNLKDWAPKVKEAMLFLNHLRELKFLVINDSSSPMVTLNHFRTNLSDSAQESPTKLPAVMRAFKASQKPDVVRYPLTISTVYTTNGKEVSKQEKWLIQQGIGDIDNPQQTWIYSGSVQPRHGIAAPVQGDLKGKVFCFLPLPIESKLPVHINGHFVLESTRRQLWHSTDPGREDDKAIWNKKIFEAIASSYANFLAYAHNLCITDKNFKNHLDAYQALNNFYELFPVSNSRRLDGDYLTLAENTYRKLVEHNSCILAVVYKERGSDERVRIKWCPVKSDEPQTQVYFWKFLSSISSVQQESASSVGTATSSTPYSRLVHSVSTSGVSSAPSSTAHTGFVPRFLTDFETRSSSSSTDSEEYGRKNLKPLFKSLGMNLTAAPSRLQSHLNHHIPDDHKLMETTPQTVFAYYQNFSSQAITVQGVHFPCNIKDTIFQRPEVFEWFIDYLLPKTDKLPVDDLFSIPLLLTADDTLRMFDKAHLVLKSEYSGLFPTESHLFLHSKLLSVNYDHCYFVSKTNSAEIIKNILTDEIPIALQTVKLSQFRQHISQERLKSLWKCFKNDSCFRSQQETILKTWALIPTTGGDVYSTASQVLPVYPLSSEVESGVSREASSSMMSLRSFERVLNTLKMPFVDIAPLSEARPGLPHLNNHVDILKNMYHLSIIASFTELLTADIVSTIFQYLKAIDFRNNRERLSLIWSLPIFEDVTGRLLSIHGKTVYMCASSACTKGYSKWIRSYPDTVFLKPYAAWHTIGPEQLCVSHIRPEDVYTKFVFKAFDTMNEAERYDHLANINHSLFSSNKSRSQIHLSKRPSLEEIKEKDQATNFIYQLENLCCIGGDGKPLRPVRDYCDHTVPIFTAFNKQYRFLPEYFTAMWNKWSKFFMSLKLRRTVSRPEFIDLCTLTADVHDDPKASSTVLLNHLFSNEIEEEKWWSHSSFTSQLAQIKFVVAEQVPRLAWIKSPYQSSESLGRNISKDGKKFSLTKFHGSTLSGNDQCIWTIRPIIQLPMLNLYSPGYKQWISDLGIAAQPTSAEVIKNLSNISALSKFNDFKLFDNCPETRKPPETVDQIVDVIESHFRYLQNAPDGMSHTISDISCIPIPITSNETESQRWQVVLVKPCVVLNTDVKGYHPFLHTLPEKLKEYLGLLQDSGVAPIITEEHCRLVLELAYNHSEEHKLDKSTKKCAVLALKMLYRFSKNKETAGELSPPLYLPTSNDTLLLSTDMFYTDSSTLFGNLKMKLENYTIVEFNPWQDYGITGYEFCTSLPLSVRPKPISELYEHKILPQYKTSVDAGVLQTSIEKTLQMKEYLPSAICAVVKHLSGTTDIKERVVHTIRYFFSKIKVSTVQSVNTGIILKVNSEKIDEKVVDFHFQEEDVGSEKYLFLYIASKTSETLALENIVNALTTRLLDVIKHEFPSVNDLSWLKMGKVISWLLNQNTPIEVLEVLTEILSREKIVKIGSVPSELGKVLPAIWHHRLDQAIDNVFHNEELVGYEVEEGIIVLARVSHPVMPTDGSSLDSVPHVNMKYRIYTSPDDVEGIDVGILKLYKFLRGLKHPKQADEDTQDVVPFQGDSEPIKLQSAMREQTLEEIKADLLKTLDYIFNLPEEDRKKAIKRLCLKWHPDKNPENSILAEEVFKFLDSEIDRRTCKSGRMIHRDDLNATAKRHRENVNREWQHWRDFQSAQISRPSEGASPSSGASFERGSQYQREDSPTRDFGGAGWTYQGDPFSEQSTRPSRDQSKGIVWLKQAQANHESLEVLLEVAQYRNKVCADVCFMAHQVAEKALKAGKFFLCGLEANSLITHNLSGNAYGLQHEAPGQTHGLLAHATALENNYIPPRYPNWWSPGTVPADKYNYDEAKTARDHAKAVLDIVKNIIESPAGFEP